MEPSGQVSPNELAFETRDHALMTGLKAQHLNGHVVLVMGFHQRKKRYEVFDVNTGVGGKKLLIKPKNLKEAFWVDNPSRWDELYSDWEALMFHAVSTTTTLERLNEIYAKFSTHFGDTRGDTRTKFAMMINWITAAQVKAPRELKDKRRKLCQKVIDDCPYGAFVLDAKINLIGMDLQEGKRGPSHTKRFQEILLPHITKHYGRYYEVVHFLHLFGHKQTEEMRLRTQYYEKCGLYYGARNMSPQDAGIFGSWFECAAMYISDKYLGDGVMYSGTPEDTHLGVEMLKLFLSQDFKDKADSFMGNIYLWEALLAFTDRDYVKVVKIVEEYEAQRSKIQEMRDLKEQILLVKAYAFWHLQDTEKVNECIEQIENLGSVSLYLYILPKLKERIQVARLKTDETEI